MMDDKKNNINGFNDGEKMPNSDIIKNSNENYNTIPQENANRFGTSEKTSSSVAKPPAYYGSNYSQDPNMSGQNAQFNGGIPPKPPTPGSRYVSGGTPKKSNTLTKGAAVVVVVICMFTSMIFGFTGGVVANKLSSTGTLHKGELGLQTAVSRDPDAQNVEYTGEAMSTESVASYAAESVVEISTESVQRGSMMQQYVVQGAGSGVIVTQDGYIITNNHVIEGASKITVRLKDTTSYDAKLIGTDSQLDVALLKIEATGLKPVVMGDSSQLQVGEKAIAIGNPLGELGGTVTEGIISSLDRTIVLNNTSMTLLQTDAAINPGNSGGGLFNSQGEFIGLVVAKSSGEDVEGLGFAIPVNNVKPVVQDLSTYGYVKGRPQLGVSLTDISSTQSAKRYGVSQTGVYVAAVSEGSAAANAGMKEGDLIISIDGAAVGTSSEVQQIIRNHSVGDVINIQISRSGQLQTLPVTLGESTPSTPQSTTPNIQSTQPNSQDQQYNPFSQFGF